ncbi:glycosyl transferase [Diplodia corticola]|uniref:Glycosyl transferase n=1 Tax=Diplodia corticola TaxID=236234 RepID=A0A1J9R229_9PEZI|nr:glycosyl transferase [Diplodia corticola]OJD34298.1 glycosyl transferase [Diplodia corticola]
MSNRNARRALVAERPSEIAGEASSNALVVYDQPALELQLTVPDPNTDVAVAYTSIDGNVARTIEMVEEAFHHAKLYTADEVEEMFELLREQSSGLCSLALAAKAQYDKSLQDMKERAGHYVKKQAEIIQGHEQHTNNTIAVQHQSILTLQQNFSRLTLHNGCMRGENRSLTNENYALRERQALIEGFNANLQNQMWILQEQHKRKLDELVQKHKEEKECCDERLFKAFRTISEIKKCNESLKEDAEKAVDAAMMNLEKRCQEYEEAKKLRIEIKTLKDKMKAIEEDGTKLVESKLREMQAVRKLNVAEKSNQELRKTLQAKYDKPDEREMAAIAKRDDSSGKPKDTMVKLDQLYEQLADQKKANNELQFELSETKDCSEYFALQAKEACKRELRALSELAELRRLCAQKGICPEIKDK